MEFDNVYIGRPVNFTMHLDSYAGSEGFGSTEGYIRHRLGGREFLKLDDPRTFYELLDIGLVGDGTFVRTTTGIIDRCFVLEGGKYIGIHVTQYPNEEREFAFEEVFEAKYISDGYIVESKGLLGRLDEVEIKK